MRKKVLEQNEKTGAIPEITIMFCGNRAVVSACKQRKDEKGFSESYHEDHTEIHYGIVRPFFWFLLGVAVVKVFYKNF